MEQKKLIPFRRIYIQDFVPAIVICFSYLNVAIGVSGISIIIAFLLIWLVALMVVYGYYTIPYKFCIFISYIFLFFFISFALMPQNKVLLGYFERFLLYNLSALIIGMQNIKKEKCLKYVTVIGFIFLPLALSKNYFENGAGKAMGASYALLPILLISIIEIYNSKSFIIKIIAIINTVAIFFKFLRLANRGVWLIFFSFILFLFFVRLQKTGIRKYRKIKITFFTMLVFIFLFWFVLNFKDVITAVYYFLRNRLNINVYGLRKMLSTLDRGDVTNGRRKNYTTAFTLIKNNFFFGKGIGYYESILDGAHTHNLFLQALCEGGVFFFIPILIYFNKILKNILQVSSQVSFNDFNKKWNILIFCCSIEYLLISSVYWLWPLFWFFLGTFLKSGYVKTNIFITYKKT